MFCTNCGKEIANNAVICVHCGVPPQQEKKYCSNCGTGVAVNQVICVNCGFTLKSGDMKTIQQNNCRNAQHSRILAALLALFIGWLGIHKFYYRSWGWGLVYAGFVVLTCFYGFLLTDILGIIEAILLFTMSDEKFNEKYNETPPSPFKW